MRDPYQLCSDLLTQVVNLMTGMGSELPETQYVAPGQTVAYDGPQVTTNTIRIFAGQPGAEDQFQYSDFVYMSIEMMVVIVRNTPSIMDGVVGEMTIPSPTDIQTSAQQMLSDTVNLTQALLSIRYTNSLGTQGMPVGVGPVQSVGPEGGVVAVTGSLTMPLL